MDEIFKILVPIGSFLIAALALYRTTKKDAGEDSANILRLKIMQTLKSRDLKESEIGHAIDPINNKIPQKEVLSQLYVLLKDRMITQRDGGGEWIYSLATSTQEKLQETSPNKNILIYKYSYECIERWDSQDFRVFRDAIREFFTKGSNIDKNALYTRLSSEKDLSRSLVFVFNYFQEIFGKIGCGLIDKSIIYHSLGDSYIKIHEMFFSWVTEFLTIDDYMKNDLTTLYQDIKKSLRE